MSVNEENPIVSYSGGFADYNFSWSSTAESEIRVELDGVLLGLSIQYEIQEYDPTEGGVVHFFEVPENTSTILIYRDTPVTQQLNLTDAAFPSEAIEAQFDKDTRILQEQIFGNKIVAQNVNLNSVQGPSYVDITNTGGSDARIPSWVVNEDKAGVFHGEITNAAPANGASTSKPDGFMWIEVLP
jgi:hypothetical protein